MFLILSRKGLDCYLDKDFIPPRLDVTIPISYCKSLYELMEVFVVDKNSVHTPTKQIIRSLPNPLLVCPLRNPKDLDPMFHLSISYNIEDDKILLDVPIDKL